MDNARRRQLVTAFDRAAAAVGRRVGSARRGAADTDLVIAAILARRDGPSLADPAGFVRFLRDCFGQTSYAVSELRRADGEMDVAAVRFQTLVEHLAAGVAPLGEADAVRLGQIADELLARRDPFVRPTWVGDAGLHAAIASSFGRKGRLLAAVVRLMDVHRAIELGTGYGMSALFIASTMADGGQLVTAERSEPQLSIATEILEREHRDTVSVVGGISTELAAGIRERIDAADLLFHDGEHSRQAYIDDFAAFEPLLRPGAVVLYDDIDWDDPRPAVAAETYAGWHEVQAHPRVRRAVEIDGELGLLLLR